MEPAVKERKHSFNVIKNINRGEVDKLRAEILSCAAALRDSCSGVQRFNPQYFVETIGNLENSISSRKNEELTEGWFSGFYKPKKDGWYEMVTTVEVRQVSRRE